MQFPDFMAREDINLLYNVYNEPGRYYHNLDHIKFMLAKLFEFESEGGFSEDGIPISEINRMYETVVLAVWWHDSIYNNWVPGPLYNETESARFYKSNSATRTHKSWEVNQLIETSIIATGRHTADHKKAHLATKLLLDLDLMALSLPMYLVERNTVNLMREQLDGGRSSKEILEGQKAFLSALIDKPRIFYTEYFHDNYEDLARANISKLLQRSTVSAPSILETLLDIAERTLVKNAR